MKEVIVRAENGRLHPRDPHSQEIILGLSRDVDVMAKIWQPRNLQQTRFMYALLNKIARTHPDLTTPEAILHHFKIFARLFDPIVGHDGRTYIVPRSLSFTSMDQAEFQQIFEHQFKPFIRERVLPGVTDADLYREVMDSL